MRVKDTFKPFSNRRPWHPLAAALCGILIAGPLAGQPPAAYEEPPTLSAELVLSPELRAGPHHQVSEEVENDGYLNTYTIESDFGLFTARGEALLRERIQELQALAALSEVTKTESFAKAVGEAAMAPVKTVTQLATHPVQTVKGLPSGVSRYFKRTSRKVKKAGKETKEALSEDEETEAAGGETGEAQAAGTETGEAEAPAGEGEGTLHKTQEVATDVTKRYLGVGRSKREWAQKLGVDPYSSNETLQRELDRVAGVAAVGSFGVRLATPSLGALDYLCEANKLVWTMSPTDLEVLNIKRLKEMGLEKAEIEALFENLAYSPSRLTGLVAALHGLATVPDRGELIRLAAAATTEEEAFFFQHSAEGLRVYQGEVAPVREIASGEVWGGGITADGTFAMTVALDYVPWTETAATAFGTAAGHFRGQAGVERLVLWLTGRVSPRAREELEKLGWKVEEEMRERWLN